jgi:molybdenum cofactor cytidylyltransferase
MKSIKKCPISAIIVAGGLSTRMGRLKQLLPYGNHTVIEQIVSVLLQCPLAEIVVVTGHERQAVEAQLAPWPVRPVFNSNYRAGEMLSSIQCGLAALNSEMQAAMVVLGDQPQLQAEVVRQLIELYQAGAGRLIMPSFQMRRGHPIVIDRAYWPEILNLAAGKILRDVINAHAGAIHYVIVETDSVLHDIDTPEQYQQALRHLDANKTPHQQNPLHPS